MDYGNVEFKTSVLNVPLAITPLKFLRWLEDEASAIHCSCTESSFAIIKLFLPMRIRLAFTRQQLDEFLQGLPNTYPHIHWIDVVQVEHSLSEEEMLIIREEQQRRIVNLANSVDKFLRSRSLKK